MHRVFVEDTTMNGHLKRNLVILFGSILIILAIIYDLYSSLEADKDEVIEGLSDSLIRFHVIANSDNEEDQAVKVKVKDAVLEKMQVFLEDATSIDESREIILENMIYFKQMAIDVLRDNGFQEDVVVSLKNEEFPLKQYGDVVLPPGEYEALVIRIGAAQGKNWWCVLFPPLCFVDATHGVIDSGTKEELRKVLTEEEWESVIMNKEEADVKIKSKLLEWLSDKGKELKEDSMFASLLK